MFKKYISQHLHYSFVLLFCLISASCTDLQTNYFSGSAIKGVISGGLVKVYAIDGNQELLGETKTDQFGQFTLNTSTEIHANSLLLLELSVDQNTRMRCDLIEGCLDTVSGQIANFGDNIQLPSNFKLHGLATSDANKYVSAFISPLSHLVVATATQHGQTLDNDSVKIAIKWVMDAFKLSSSPIQTRPVDITQLATPTFMTDGQLKQSIINASLYTETLLPEWSQGNISIDSIDLQDVLIRATQLSGDLSALIKPDNHDQATRLEQVQSITQSQLDSLQSSDITILSQPTSITITEQEAFSLSVQAISDLGLSFQWFKDNKPLLGANSPIYAKTNSHISDAGIYHVLISNGAREQLSLSANLVINKAEQALQINQQPSSQSVVEGETISLTVEASGDGSINYQWFKNDTPISGANANSYSISNAKVEDAGNYYVLVANASKQIASNFINVWVASAAKPILISQQPTSQTINAGTSFAIKAIATSEDTLTYQWYKDGNPIMGANSAIYSKTYSELSDSGLYRVVISNSTSKKSSASATISVNKIALALEIMQQPIPLSITEGEPAVLSVLAIGDGAITYQWQKNGSLIPGATSNTYTIPNSKPLDSGNYRVVVSNGSKQISSNFVNVWVSEAVKAIAISQHPQTQVVPEGNDAKFTVVADGGGFIRYQWRKDGVNIPNAFNDSLSITAATQTDSGNYDVIVSNSQGSQTSSSASLSVLDTRVPVMITQQVSSRSVLSNSPLTLNVSATGDAPISYQWFLDGNAIEAANSPQYHLATASIADQGVYTVLVSNPNSSELSKPAYITVTPPQLGSIELTWDTPTEREDGRALSFTEIQGYVIEYGSIPLKLQNSLFVENVLPNSTIIYDLLPGTLYLRIATVDSDNVQGTFSETISITIP